MAKVKIQGNASGTGVLTVTAPNTSTDRTITLPDTTGTLLDENSSVPAANLTGTIADARISTLTASKLTGALPAISGASLTGITTGKVLQVVKGGISNVSTHSAGASTYDTVYNVSISNVQSTSTIIGFVMFQGYISSAGADFAAFVFRGSTSIGGGTAADSAASALIVNRREADANVSFHANGQFEDTGHGGGSLTYDFKVMNENTIYLGRPSQSGQPRHGRGQNNMILMEIGA